VHRRMCIYTVPMAYRRKPRANHHPWVQMRKQHLLTYPECRVCERTDDVVVHHLRYRGPRGESERPGDLMTLCVRHHDNFHRRYPTGSLVQNTLTYVQDQRALALDAAMQGR
jgi:5-methylcytosine-specific restriction endonuclease McrA